MEISNNENVILGIRPENLLSTDSGQMIIKIDLIEKSGADSIIYGTDENENILCYRENGNTNINIGENIFLSVEKGKFHIFDTNSKKNLI